MCFSPRRLTLSLSLGYGIAVCVVGTVGSGCAFFFSNGDLIDVLCYLFVGRLFFQDIKLRGKAKGLVEGAG